MGQLSLLDAVQREQRPWKRTTGTSREAIRVVEAEGTAEFRREQILLAIRRIWNRTQQSPTADEIAADLFARKLIPDDHPDYVKPRLSELKHGRTIRVKGEGGVIQEKQIGGGLIEKAGKRKSARSGRMVHTWRVIERGTAKAVNE